MWWEAGALCESETMSVAVAGSCAFSLSFGLACCLFDLLLRVRFEFREVGVIVHCVCRCGDCGLENLEVRAVFAVDGRLEGLSKDICCVLICGYSPNSHVVHKVVLFYRVMSDVDRS